MGVIAVETRTIERIVPADPANASSMEQKIMEAGQVRSSSSDLFLAFGLTRSLSPGLVPQLGVQDRASHLRL